MGKFCFIFIQVSSNVSVSIAKWSPKNFLSPTSFQPWRHAPGDQGEQCRILAPMGRSLLRFTAASRLLQACAFVGRGSG